MSTAARTAARITARMNAREAAANTARAERDARQKALHTVANEDHLPWAEVKAAKALLGIPEVDAVAEARAARVAVRAAREGVES